MPHVTYLHIFANLHLFNFCLLQNSFYFNSECYSIPLDICVHNSRDPVFHSFVFVVILLAVFFKSSAQNFLINILSESSLTNIHGEFWRSFIGILQFSSLNCDCPKLGFRSQKAFSSAGDYLYRKTPL